MSVPPNADMLFKGGVEMECSDEEADGRVVGRGKRRRRSAIVSDDEGAEDMQEAGIS